LWVDYTKRTLTELDNEWRASLARQPQPDEATSVPASAPAKSLEE
jgi:hypothetical protein